MHADPRWRGHRLTRITDKSRFGLLRYNPSLGHRERFRSNVISGSIYGGCLASKGHRCTDLSMSAIITSSWKWHVKFFFFFKLQSYAFDSKCYRHVIYCQKHFRNVSAWYCYKHTIVIAMVTTLSAINDHYIVMNTSCWLSWILVSKGHHCDDLKGTRKRPAQC